MATGTALAPVSSSNTVRVGVDIPSITTTTKTEFIGFDGKVITSTVDANGQPRRIHKVITTTKTITCFGDDDLALLDDQTIEEKFVEQVMELGADTKDVFLHTAANVQQALETAGDYIRTRLTSSSDNTGKVTATTTTTEKDQTNFLQQASALKDVLVQKAIDIKDATVDVIKDLANPQEEMTASDVDFDEEMKTPIAEKKNE